MLLIEVPYDVRWVSDANLGDRTPLLTTPFGRSAKRVDYDVHRLSESDDAEWRGRKGTLSLEEMDESRGQGSAFYGQQPLKAKEIKMVLDTYEERLTGEQRASGRSLLSRLSGKSSLCSSHYLDRRRESLSANERAARLSN
ncbi:hypothetical protein V3C99_006482 [Haemonchus contortus]